MEQRNTLLDYILLMAKHWLVAVADVLNEMKRREKTRDFLLRRFFSSVMVSLAKREKQIYLHA
jgi:hypothetical protein